MQNAALKKPSETLENAMTETATALRDYIFTSESVSEGHPDKVCDRISDAILDKYLSLDPTAHVAIETAVTTNFVAIMGETRGPDSITKDVLENIARDAIRDIGYEQNGFHWKTADIDVRVHNQSADIAIGVDEGNKEEEGAGDQGIMFGYACSETDALMPAPLHYSHTVLRTLAKDRHAGKLPNILPDSKAQFSLEYKDNKPIRATSIVVSTQHTADISQEEIREIVRPYILSVLPDESWMCAEEDFFVNPTGRFVIGGPDGDTGLTGRKIVVDTYGGSAPHGGGAFSGKDPSKVDRSAAYAARYLAKNIVAAGYAERCTIQLAYAIGVAHPLSVYINTMGTGTVPEAALVQAVQKTMDLTPRGIREHLALNRPIYAKTAAYGHFGRKPSDDGSFSWEKTDLVKALHQLLG